MSDMPQEPLIAVQEDCPRKCVVLGCREPVTMYSNSRCAKHDPKWQKIRRIMRQQLEEMKK